MASRRRPVHLSEHLLEEIMKRASYYDTLAIGSLNEVTGRLVDKKSLWKAKYRLEKGIVAANSFNIRNWRIFYFVTTDRLGSRLDESIGRFDGVVNSFIASEEVYWLVTPAGLVYSLLKAGLDIAGLVSEDLWVQSSITEPISFVREMEGSKGHAAFAVSEAGNIYLLRSANQSSRLLLEPEGELVASGMFKGQISDVAYEPKSQHLLILLRSGEVFAFAIQEGEIASGGEQISSEAVALINGEIATRVEEVGNMFLFTTSTSKGGDQTAKYEMAKQRAFITAPSVEDRKSHLEKDEFPEAPVQVDTLDTHDLLAPLNRAAGAYEVGGPWYDREGEADIVDTVFITEQEILEGSNVD